jgi:hypothetical protein
MFDPTALKNLPKALSKAQFFEYEWLKARQDYYTGLGQQDNKRIQMIQDRLNQSISSK